MTEKVTGIGGVFFRAKDPQKLAEWYAHQLGVELDYGASAIFRWRETDEPEQEGMTVWSPFDQDTDYFGPGQQAWMINYRVKDLDAMLQQLRKAGAEVIDKVEESEYGRFGWAVDPEGNRMELWEPPASTSETS